MPIVTWVALACLLGLACGSWVLAGALHLEFRTAYGWATGCLLAAGISALGGHAAATEQAPWIAQLFTALLQGSATLMGVVLASVMVSFQVSSARFEPEITSRSLLRNSLLWLCVGGYAAVMVLGAIGLASKPGQTWCGVVLGLSSWVGILTVSLTCLVVQQLLRGSGVAGLTREFVQGLLRFYGIKRKYGVHLADAVALLSHASATGEYRWRSTWNSYACAVRDTLDSRSGVARAIAADALTRPVRSAGLDPGHQEQVSNWVWDLIDHELQSYESHSAAVLFAGQCELLSAQEASREWRARNPYPDTLGSIMVAVVSEGAYRIDVFKRRKDVEFVERHLGTRHGAVLLEGLDGCDCFHGYVLGCSIVHFGVVIDRVLPHLEPTEARDVLLRALSSIEPFLEDFPTFRNIGKE